ncbi:MAG: efflux RND transporter periplasmic adaptor subunit [Candidatus Eiseniibacteriota bacterium]
MKRTVLVALLATALALFALTACSPREGKGDASREETWFCPMHPQVISDRPGECPICHMSLVPATEAGTDGAMSAHVGELETGAGAPAGHAPISISAEKARLIGMRWEVVTRAPFAAPIRTVGRIEFDERRVHHVHTRYEGYVDHVFADFGGKFVRKGEPLASIYSPELLTTQEEYLLALAAARDAAARDGSVPRAAQELVDAAKRRLLLWEVDPAEIEELERTGKPLETLRIYAPISGVVTERTAYHGMKVGPEDTLFDLADLSRVWVIADVYEYELPRVAVGQEGMMTLPYWPGRIWTGAVGYIFPTVDEKARTVKVRLEFENAGGDLKPGMFADVVLSGRSATALSVPEDAVLDSGTRKLVFVRTGEERLEPREVVTGVRAGGRMEILQGVTEGDSVALGANFLLDSESRLRAAVSSASGGATRPVDDHAGHGRP